QGDAEEAGGRRIRGTAAWRRAAVLHRRGQVRRGLAKAGKRLSFPHAPEPGASTRRINGSTSRDFRLRGNDRQAAAWTGSVPLQGTRSSSYTPPSASAVK